MKKIAQIILLILIVVFAGYAVMAYPHLAGFFPVATVIVSIG